MAVNNVSGNYNNYSTYLAEKNKPLNQQGKAQEPVEETKAVEGENTSADGDKYVPTTNYKTDFNKVSAMKSGLWNKIDAFEKMVNALFNAQGIQYNQAKGMKANLEELIASGGVSEADRLAAQQAISEDGEWGVKNTANRILDFAKALSGGDPSKIEYLRAAVEKGFKEAEKTWGGKLPEISQKTYDRVMQGFDDWAKSAQAATEANTK